MFELVCIIHGHGKLGNIMFLLACGISYCWKYGIKLKYFHDNYEYYDTLKYGIFKDIETIRGNKDFYMLQGLYNPYPFIYLKLPNPLMYKNILPPPDNSNLVFVGYFLNPLFFSRLNALDLFSPKDDIIEFIRDLYNEVPFENCVSVHVRRGDYLLEDSKREGFVVNGMDFYLKAFNMFFPKDLKYVVTSDDMDWCKENFIGDNFYFLDKHSDNEVYSDEFVDLYAASICKHNIISNSTYSWWGAYLNQNPSRKVLYRYPWIDNKGYSDGIVPLNDNWIIVK